MRSKSNFLVAIIVVLGLTAASAEAVAPVQNETIKGEPFTSLVVFSGSLSDTGNYASVFGDFPFPFYHNRTTNGPAAIEIFASKFGLSAEPSLHLIGQQRGLNYAVLHANAYGNSEADLPGQVRAYLDSHHNTADSNGLFFIFIGANDIVSATTAQSDQEAQTILNNAIFAVESAFRNLHAAGAQIFYAPNNVNIGLAPVALQFGVSARATELSIVFNRMWEEKLSQLERELNVVIFRFDFFRQVQDLISVGGTLGFTNITDSCVALIDAGKCDLDRFAFVNELLPTRRIHEFFGNALAESLIQQLKLQPPHRPGRKSDIRPYSFIDLPVLVFTN
jgi:phospholipase/lecithinase/hemolysin